MKSKLRVGMVLDDAFPPDPRVENEIVCLQQAGYQVFLLVLGRKTDVNHDVPTGLIVDYVEFPRWVRNKASALAYTLPIYHRLLCPHITHFIEERKIQTLHVHDLRVARSAFQANKKFQLPLILDLHENRPEIMKHYAHVNRFPGNLLISTKKWAQFEHAYCLEATKTIVVTEEARSAYRARAIPSEKLHVVSNTIDDRFLDRSIQVPAPAEKIRMIYVGDTSERRGLLDVIQAIGTLPLELRNKLELKILGQSSFQPRLIENIQKFGLEECIQLLGWQDYDGIHKALRESNIGICPLHRNEHHDTTYANKLFQYMAYGLALMVSDCEAQANLVKDNSCGLVHKANSVSSIGQSLKWFLENEDDIHRYGQAAFKCIREEYTLSQVGQSLIDLYDSIPD